MPSKIITFTLNGRETEVLVKPLTTLQTLLREQLRLTAVKSGCRQGGCGSCTVLLNDQPVLSCLLPVEDVAGQNVTTLEGVGVDGQLHPVQQAFFDEYAVQCGYCTPGMIVTSTALLNQNPHPERAQILDALTGNYCRCTGYEPIVRAIQEAARRMDGQD
jgi:aerobic carbon-monoxide dehydrogenase small subunit